MLTSTLSLSCTTSLKCSSKRDIFHYIKKWFKINKIILIGSAGIVHKKTITQIIITGIILTYSKGVFLIVAIILPIYILTIKNKKHRQEIVQNILISTIISIIYVILFEKLESDKDYISIWIMFVITNLISYIINILIENLQITEKEIKSIKLIAVLIVIGLIIYVII